MAPLIGALGPVMGAMSAAAPFLKVAGPIIGAGGGILGGIFANRAAQQRAGQAREDARSAEEAALRNSQMMAAQNQIKLRGLYTSLTASSGLEPGGSPTEVLRQFAAMSSRNEFMTKFSGEVRGSSLRSYAKSEESRGKGALLAGFGKGAGTLLTGVPQIQSGFETIQSKYGRNERPFFRI